MKFSEFLKACQRLAHSVTDTVEKRSRLADLSTALDPDDPDLLEGFNLLVEAGFTDYAAEIFFDDDMCRVMLVSISPNGVIGLHNHPHQYGFIFCMQGHVKVDIYDEISVDGEFGLLRYVSSPEIRAGGYVDLTVEERNFHRLEGLEQTFLVDVFMPPLKDENRKYCRRYEDPPLAQPNEIVRAKIIPRPE